MRLPNGYGGVVKLSGNRRRPYAARITTGWHINDEDENGSTVDLSGSVTKEEAQETKPTDKPVPIGDTTNKDEVPSYPEEVPVTAPEVQVPADNSESSHPGQVYDPVFGWIR